MLRTDKVGTSLCGARAGALVQRGLARSPRHAAQQMSLAFSKSSAQRQGIRVRAAADVAADATSDMPESWSSPPKGYKVYETMIIYNPDALDSEREAEIQSFTDLLAETGALDVAVSYENVPQRMADPIEGYNVGIYVLYMYSAPSSAAKKIQKKLSAPSIEKERSVLRFMTTRA